MTRDLLHAIATDTRSALGWGLRRLTAWVDQQDQKLASALDPGWEDRP